MPTCSQSARYASPGPKPAPAMPSASIRRSTARATVRLFGVPFLRPALGGRGVPFNTPMKSKLSYFSQFLQSDQRGAPSCHALSGACCASMTKADLDGEAFSEFEFLIGQTTQVHV